jgi:hypothetical protein
MHIDRDALYSLAELSEMSGLSLRTLQRLIAKGDLPVRRLGSRVYVRGCDLLDGLPSKPEPAKRRTRKPK